jgi:glycosyltransferase involved in cell wall biosynthesis
MKRKIIIGTVSTSTPNKGFDFFLSCCNALIPFLKTKNIEVEVICATQDEKLLSRSVRNVRFIKPDSDKGMNSFYNECDVFFSTSYSEGFSLPTLESMACGCFVISTDCGGISDFLINFLLLMRFILCKY